MVQGTGAMTRRGLASLILATPALIVGRGQAEAPITMRASLDTSPTHARTIAIADYLKKVEAAANGRIKTELFP